MEKRRSRLTSMTLVMNIYRTIVCEKKYATANSKGIAGHDGSSTGKKAWKKSAVLLNPKTAPSRSQCAQDPTDV